MSPEPEAEKAGRLSRVPAMADAALGHQRPIVNDIGRRQWQHARVMRKRPAPKRLRLIVEGTPNRVVPKLEVIARIGYASRGIVYLIIGGIAVLAALDSRRRAVGTKGALTGLLAEQFGRVLLVLMAIGLFCFAVWRALQTLVDADHRGSGWRALMQRVGYGFGCAFYLGLALWAASATLGWGIGGKGDEKALHEWTAYLTEFPLGRWLVAIIGASVIGTGIAVAVNAFSTDLGRWIAAQSSGWQWLGRIGLLAQSLVLLLIGGFLIEAAINVSSRQAKGLAGALQALQQYPYGWVLLALTALGLISFGTYQLVEAARRQIDVRI